MAGTTSTTKRTAVALRPLVEQLDAVLSTCETTVTQGTEFLALLLRLAAPMPSIDGDGAKNYHRARLRALAILRHGGHTQHGHSDHKGVDAQRKLPATGAVEHVSAGTEAPRATRARHGHSVDHGEENPQAPKETPRTRHTQPEAGMDFVD